MIDQWMPIDKGLPHGENVSGIFKPARVIAGSPTGRFVLGFLIILVKWLSNPLGGPVGAARGSEGCRSNCETKTKEKRQLSSKVRGRMFLLVLTRKIWFARCKMQKLQRVILLTCIISFTLLNIAFAGLFGPSDYDECINERLKGVSSDVAARAIIHSCKTEFPDNKKEKIPVKCKNFQQLPASKTNDYAAYNDNNYNKPGALTFDDIPYTNPEYQKCLEECKNANYIKKTFGECRFD